MNYLVKVLQIMHSCTFITFLCYILQIAPCNLRINKSNSISVNILKNHLYLNVDIKPGSRKTKV